MKVFLSLLVFLLLAQLAPAPPVSKTKAEEEGKEHPESEDKDLPEFEDFGLEYGKYLQQVVQALEEDKDFAKKLENVSEDHIKTGEVARELEFVKHSVRTKLDELKRLEVERLRELIRRQLEQNEIAEHQIQLPKHLDIHNEHTFEVKDLKKLIQSATKDLEELDKKRRQEFKQYEMEKEYRYRESLKNMTEEQKKEALKHHEEEKKKHQEHPKVHHPGSKQQLEQVWEEKDHLPKEEFNPHTFFSLHDVNSDGFWDIQEVEALLSLEVKKIYKEGVDDPVEMNEEYNRMREHIYKEVDVNKDGMISKKEFLDMTMTAEFQKDEGWKSLDEQQVFSEEEMKAYEKKRQQELKKMYELYGDQYLNHVYPGDIPYYAYDPQGYYPPQQGQYGQGIPPPQHYPQQGGAMPPPHQGAHPQQMPQQQPNQPQHYQQGVPQQPYHDQSQGMPPQHFQQQQGVPLQHPQAMAGQHPQQQQAYQQGLPPQHPQAMAGQHPQQQQAFQQGVPPQHPQAMAGQHPQQQQAFQQGIPPQHAQQFIPSTQQQQPMIGQPGMPPAPHSQQQGSQPQQHAQPPILAQNVPQSGSPSVSVSPSS